MSLELRSFARMDDTTRAAFIQAHQEWTARLFGSPIEKRSQSKRTRAWGLPLTARPDRNVVGVAIGEKIVNGRPAGVRSLKFYVRRKYALAEMQRKFRLPKEIDGLPVDVEQVGTLRAFAVDPRARLRPARPGSSIGFVVPGNFFQDAGTLGAFVTDGQDTYILSNNHVLADLDNMPPGTPIVQPGPFDQGRPNADQVAILAQTVPLQRTGSNSVDCALAKLLDPANATNDLPVIGTPLGTTSPAEHMEVHKYGRTTEYTVGRISGVHGSMALEFQMSDFTNITLQFSDQIVIKSQTTEAFSAEGDSGSLIVERGSQLAVGLLVGGSSQISIASDLDQVLSQLGVNLVV